MSSGTKAFLAVFALLLGVLVIYYGMMMPDSGPATASAVELRPGMRPQSDDPNLITPRTRSRDPLIALGESALPPMQQQQPAAAVHTPPPQFQLPQTKPQPEASKPTVQAPPPQPRPAQPPAEAPKKPAQAPPQVFEYTVKNGDTMSSIAQEWFGDANKWSLIAKANPLIDPARMQIGMKLRLPPKDARPETVHELLADGSAIYTVRSGDSLAEIAREYYGNVQMWETIYAMNRDAIGDEPTALSPGMRLTLPPPPKPAE